MTSSRWRCPSSRLPRRTRFRSWKSKAGSFPGTMAVGRGSGAIEAAREGARDAALEGAGERASDWGTVEEGAGFCCATTGAETVGAVGGRRGAPLVLRFWLMMEVNWDFTDSRSARAACPGDVKMNMKPLSSPVREIFILTCGEPSLLQNRAGQCRTRERHELTT